MNRQEKMEALNDAYNRCISSGSVRNKAEFADFVGVNRSTISSAFSGNEAYLTDKLIAKVVSSVGGGSVHETGDSTIPIIPTGARASTLADWSASVKEYDCERMVSPIRGADYAIQVTGDSMSPEFPSGSHILVKKIDEAAFIAWGEVYLLDTVNGPVLKRVRKTEREDVVECVSINPAYQPFRVECRSIIGWYRVLLCLSLK